MKYPRFMCGTCNFGCLTFDDLVKHIQEMEDGGKTDNG